MWYSPICYAALFYMDCYVLNFGDKVNEWMNKCKYENNDLIERPSVKIEMDCLQDWMCKYSKISWKNVHIDVLKKL